MIPEKKDAARTAHRLRELIAMSRQERRALGIRANLELLNAWLRDAEGELAK